MYRIAGRAPRFDEARASVTTVQSWHRYNDLVLHTHTPMIQNIRFSLSSSYYYYNIKLLHNPISKLLPIPYRIAMISSMNNNNDDDNNSNLTDIEDLHNIAVSKLEQTYIDPATGFTVFTEVAHLKRGKCCGNMCRHCPYGWENVRGVRKDGSSPITEGIPVKKLMSGDKVMAKALLNQCTISGIKFKDKDMYERDLDDGKKEDDSDVVLTENGGCCKSNEYSTSSSSSRRTTKTVPYTKKGDKGEAQLFTGERRHKSDLAFEALGTVDELCTFVGVAHSFILDSKEKYGPLNEQLLDVMSRLFDLGSCVATPRLPGQKSSAKTRLISFDEGHVEDLEKWIDDLTDRMPELRNFILPTGGKASAQLHVARTVCRRAERRVAEVMAHPGASSSYNFEHADICLRYLNRLSDYFFTAARWTNFCEDSDEILYKRPNTSTNQRSRISTIMR